MFLLVKSARSAGQAAKHIKNLGESLALFQALPLLLNIDTCDIFGGHPPHGHQILLVPAAIDSL